MQHTFLHYLCIVLKVIITKTVLLSVWLLVILNGLLFWREFGSPANILFGYPLMMIGMTMGVVSLYEIVVSLVSWRWCREHCPFCKPKEKVGDILNLNR